MTSKEECTCGARATCRSVRAGYPNAEGRKDEREEWVGEADERIEAPEPFLCIAPACDSDCSGCSRAISAQDSRTYAIRYAYLRSRPVDTIALNRGGVFAGMVPEKLVLNGADLDAAIDKAMTPDWAEPTDSTSKAGV